MIQEAKHEAVRNYTANRDGGATLKLNQQTSQQNVNQYYNHGIDGSRNQSCILMMRRNSTIPPLDGKATAGESLQSKFRTFQVQMHMYFQQEGCYDALYSQHPIPVFHNSREELCERFDQREVDRAQRAWEIIMEKVNVPHMIEHFAILGSPSQAWAYLVEFYSVSPLADKTKLEQKWYGLKMNAGETPTEYLGRATLILGRRRQYGGIDISDSEAKRHIARRLSSEYSWYKCKLLDMPT